MKCIIKYKHQYTLISRTTGKLRNTKAHVLGDVQHTKYIDVNK